MKWKMHWLTAIVAGITSIAAIADEGVYVGDVTSFMNPTDSGTKQFDQAYYTPEPPMSHNGISGSRNIRRTNGHPVYQESCECPDMGCYSCPPPKSFRRAACCGGEAWGSFETLVWFPQNRETPPIITGADAGFAPLPGNPGYQVLFGGEREEGVNIGFRVDGGHYFGPGNLVGIGARATLLLSESDEYNVSSTGNPSIGRYFIDPRIAPQVLNRVDNAVPIALQGVFTGAARVRTDFDYFGSEFYARLVLDRGSNGQTDFLGGYTGARLEDTLLVESVTQSLIDTTGILDLFETRNRFHGGHVGLETKLKGRWWQLSSTAKVHMGNMNQYVRRVGARQTLPGVVGISAFPNAAFPVDQQGVLNTTNLGIYQRDVFTFAPEVNLKLAVKLHSCATMSVGYTFIHWGDVALAGDQIDKVVDPLGALIVPPFEIQDRGYWLQGIDCGLTLNY